MKHIIVFCYIFTLIMGVSAFTIQYISGKRDKQVKFHDMKPFVLMLLLLNVYDFILYYSDRIIDIPDMNLMFSIGDCMIALLVLMWLKVEDSVLENNPLARYTGFAGKYLLAYIVIWMISMFAIPGSELIRIIIDLPFVLLLLLGGIFSFEMRKQESISKWFILYNILITVFLAINYITYIFSEWGNLKGLEPHVADITVFYWFIINLATFVFLYQICFRDYKSDAEQEPLAPAVQIKSVEDVLDEMKEEFDLTNRELEVLNEIYNGSTNSNIAENLFISESTVKTHIYNIFRKMGVKNRVEAVCAIRERKENEN